jgi:hypothetical protein
VSDPETVFGAIESPHEWDPLFTFGTSPGTVGRECRRCHAVEGSKDCPLICSGQPPEGDGAGVLDRSVFVMMKRRFKQRGRSM